MIKHKDIVGPLS